jgi:hypothetical protein
MDLMLLNTTDSIGQNRVTWKNVVRKVSNGEMPPESRPVPNQAELQAAMGWLKNEFERLDQLVVPTSGRVTAPMANLYLSLLDRLGVHATAIGDSTGRLELLNRA